MPVETHDRLSFVCLAVVCSGIPCGEHRRPGQEAPVLIEHAGIIRDESCSAIQHGPGRRGLPRTNPPEEGDRSFLQGDGRPMEWLEVEKRERERKDRNRVGKSRVLLRGGPQPHFDGRFRGQREAVLGFGAPTNDERVGTLVGPPVHSSSPQVPG